MNLLRFSKNLSTKSAGYICAAVLIATALPAAAQRWEVDRAEYGARGRVADVTNIVRGLVDSREPQVPVNNYTMQGDPAYGEVKILRIFARRRDGEQREFTFRENTFVDLNLFREDRGDRPPMPPPPVWGRARRPDVGVCFYRDANFHGDYFCMERGMAYESLPSGFNDRITSIRIFRGAEVTIFNDGGFHGVSGTTRESIPDLRYWRLPTDPNRNWNDRVSSIQVR